MLAVLFQQLCSPALPCISMSTIYTLSCQLSTYPGRTLNLSQYCPAEDIEVFTLQFEKVMVEVVEVAVW